MKRQPKLKPIVDVIRAEERVAAAMDALMPLDYMLAVIRDSSTAQARRDRMAIAAAPYCHARVGDTATVVGKKEQALVAARQPDAGSGLGQLMIERQEKRLEIN